MSSRFYPSQLYTMLHMHTTHPTSHWSHPQFPFPIPLSLALLSPSLSLRLWLWLSDTFQAPPTHPSTFPWYLMGESKSLEQQFSTCGSRHPKGWHIRCPIYQIFTLWFRTATKMNSYEVGMKSFYGGWGGHPNTRNCVKGPQHQEGWQAQEMSVLIQTPLPKLQLVCLG